MAMQHAGREPLDAAQRRVFLRGPGAPGSATWLPWHEVAQVRATYWLEAARVVLERPVDAPPMAGKDAVELCESCVADCHAILRASAAIARPDDATREHRRQAHRTRIAAAGLALPHLSREFSVAAAEESDGRRGAAPPSPARSCSSGTAENATAAEGKTEEVPEDFECLVCSRLFWEPITTPCGHTFCRGCLARTQDHAESQVDPTRVLSLGRLATACLPVRCPACRAALHITPATQPVTVVLQRHIEQAFPKALALRRADDAATGAAANAGDAAATNDLTLPIFAAGFCVPGVTNVRLHVFEPRYRLMIRRCLQGNRLFVMTPPDDDDGSPAKWGTTCEVAEASTVPDGRLLLTCRSVERVSLSGHGDVDGYRVAKCRPIRDEPITSPDELTELERQLRPAYGKLDAGVQAGRVGPPPEGAVLPSEEEAASLPASERARRLEALSLFLLPFVWRGDEDHLVTTTDTRERVDAVVKAGAPPRCVVS